MRKSSLGRRSSTLNCNESTLAPVQGRAEKRSFLLQPGFSQTKRRASSEEKSSLRPGNHVFQSVSKSRCDMSLIENLPPCTPKYFKDTLVLPSGSARPSRSRTSSVESNRFSSIGSIRCSKKEIRPINDKEFQLSALRKVQNYFQRQQNCLLILDNSQNVKPMTTKKFINMLDHLLKRIDERSIITKDNYIENAVKAGKFLNYGGKIDRSWLQVVNTQHAWCHVISFLVWLVDLVILQEVVSDEPRLLYPKPLYDDCCEDLLEAHIDEIQPHIVEQFQTLIKSKHPDESFERADDILVQQLLQKQGLTQEDIQNVLQEEENVRAALENPEYQMDEQRILKQDSDLHTVQDSHASLKDFIEKTTECIKSRTDSLNQMSKENAALVQSIKEKTVENNNLHEILNRLKNNQANVNEKNNKRIELQQTITYNEKCLSDLAKSIYKLEIETAKLLKKMEDPLIEYNKIIVLHTKNEPRLKSCVIDRTHLLHQVPSASIPFAPKRIVAEVDILLKTLRDEWHNKANDSKLKLDELQSKITLFKKSEMESMIELDKKKEELNSVICEIAKFVQGREKEINEFQSAINCYEEQTKKIMENFDLKDNSTIEELRQIDEQQVQEIKDTIELSKRYFSSLNTFKDQMFKDCDYQLQRVYELMDRITKLKTDEEDDSHTTEETSKNQKNKKN